MIPKWFRVAKKEAKKSTYKHKLGACVVKGGSVVSKGHNEIRYCATGANKYSEWRESLHAERAALSKLKKSEITGSSVFVVRVTEEQKWALAKPCSQCMYMLRDLGVKKVVFSISEFPYFAEIKF